MVPQPFPHLAFAKKSLPFWAAGNFAGDFGYSPAPIKKSEPSAGPDFRILTVIKKMYRV